jgi:hypothetical protein
MLTCITKFLTDSEQNFLGLAAAFVASGHNALSAADIFQLITFDISNG